MHRDRFWKVELKVSLDVGTKEIMRSETKNKREKRKKNSKKETFSNRARKQTEGATLVQGSI